MGKREIKFRAWDSKQMVYFALHETPWPYSSEWPVMQYTGLKDKNGKEIYEGDIVKFVISEGEMRSTEYATSTICFRDFEWKVGDLEDEFGDSLNQVNGEDLEVVGNIYENPELIK